MHNIIRLNNLYILYRYILVEHGVQIIILRSTCVPFNPPASPRHRNISRLIGSIRIKREYYIDALHLLLYYII